MAAPRPGRQRALALLSSQLSAHASAAKADGSGGHLREYYNQFLPRERGTGDGWRPRPGIRAATETSFYQTQWDDCEGNGPFGFKALANHSNITACRHPKKEDARSSKFGGGAHYDKLTREMYEGLPWNRSWTASGEPLGETIERSLRKAWGPTPPRIDLILRAGCGAAEELQWLYPSLELFWPSHLGDVVLVFDAGDDQAEDLLLPPFARAGQTKLSWRVVYEEVPSKLPPRIFNQASYLHFDKLSTADYFVTFDSDCVIHSPVTPDILFDDQGKLMLAFSRRFQKDTWKAQVEFFTGVKTYSAHTMVTQPVPFARRTFAEYRDWMRETVSTRRHLKHESKGVKPCLLDEISRFRQIRPTKHQYHNFCWMCQLGTFLNLTNQTANRAPYNLIQLDDLSHWPYQRHALHMTWEHRVGYNYSLTRIVHEGLCRALGNATLPTCANASNLLVNTQTFRYTIVRWGANPRASERLSSYVDNLRRAEVATRRERAQ